MNGLRPAAKVYLVSLCFAALAALLVALVGAPVPTPNDMLLALGLGVAGVVAALFPLTFGSRIKVRLSTSVMFAAVLLLNPALAMLVAGCGILVSDVLRRQQGDEIAFNTAQFVLQTAAGSAVLILAGWPGGSLQFSHPGWLAAAALAAVAMYLVNSLAVGVIIGLQENEPPLRVWWNKAFRLDRAETFAHLGQLGLGLQAAINVADYPWALLLLFPPFIAVYTALTHQATLRERAEQHLQHRAFHDALTDLPNRARFAHRLNEVLAQSALAPRYIAVLFLDLDRFKQVNDSFGHEVGDQLLVAVAGRLRGCVREGDMVARMGGDEFTILLDNLPDLAVATRIAQNIVNALHAPFVFNGRQMYVGASIGIAPWLGAPNIQAEELLQQADMAMYQAKHAGKGCFRIYEPSMQTRAHARVSLEEELRSALDNDELRVHYQPQIDLRSGRIVGWEALVRWQHPVRGLISPPTFLPLAEETGLILPLGRWVLHQACAQLSRWRQQYPDIAHTTMFVNVSARELRHPELLATIADVLRTTGLPPSALGVEITEHDLLADLQSHAPAVERLERLGVRLAIDDFGVGHASLHVLRELSADVIKIDQSFIAGVSHDQQDAAIVQAVLTLAHTLGLRAVAEGVERGDQHAALQSLGCDCGQGYFYAHSMPHDAMDAQLRTFQAPHSAFLSTPVA
jgi:diguanylate cyclase (GGDEF)-like protein